MATIYPIQDTFVRGEVSPRLHARASLDLYRAALARCENCVTLPHGGIRKRGGSYFAGEVKNSATAVRLIPFIFSVDQAYCLELGNLYLRVYAYGVRVGTVEVTTPWATADLDLLEFYQSADVMWVTHPTIQTRKLTRTAHTTWTLSTFDVEDGPYLDINQTNTTLTPAATANLSQLYAGTAAASDTPQFGTSANNVWDGNAGNIISLQVLAGWVSYTFSSGTHICDAYSVAGSAKPYLQPSSWKFQGYDGASWVNLDSQSGVTWSGGETKLFSIINSTAYSAYRLAWSAIVDAGQQYTEISEITLHQAVSEQTAFNLTASSTTGINDGAGFQTTDVGRAIRLRASDGYWRWAKIVSRTSTTVVTVTLQDQALPDLSAVAYWRLGAWSTAEGWPDSVTVFEERLSFGKKYRINTSKTGDFTNFTTGEKDDDALEFLQAGGGQANDIVWIADSDGAMIIATAGGIRALSGSGIDEALTPSSFKNRKSRTHGAARIMPVDAGSSFIYVTRSRRQIVELSADTAGRFSSNDLGIVSEHIPKRGVIELGYQSDPDPFVWFPTDTGELGCYTHQPDQDVRGMTRHKIGGALTGSDWAVVERCTVTPGQNGLDDVWLVVRRTIGGATKRYIEVMQAPFEYGDLNDAFAVDCGLTYEGSAVGTVSGLGHLNGQVVDILADGKVYKGLTVGSGQVTLPGAATAATWQVGLPFQADAATLELDVGGKDGSIIGRRKKVAKAIISLLETDTTGLRIQSLMRGKWETVRIPSVVAPDGKANLFTGNVEVPIDDSWEGRGQVRIVHDNPTPCTIRAFTPVFDAEP